MLRAMLVALVVLVPVPGYGAPADRYRADGPPLSLLDPPPVLPQRPPPEVTPEPEVSSPSSQSSTPQVERERDEVLPPGGRVLTVIREGWTPDGRRCRQFYEDVAVWGRLQRHYGTACQDYSGDWVFID
jgi:hypothetical protein